MADLWIWALKVYKGEGVAQACLQLQDDFGQNIPYILWSAWAGVHGIKLMPETIEEATDIARSYQSEIISRLRFLRKHLKSPISDIDVDARLRLYEAIKALELEAERELIQALEALVEPENTKDKQGLEMFIDVNVLSCAKAYAQLVPRQHLLEFIAKIRASV
jgi:uncharacterized protein (TIGR02444 family)